MEVQGWSQLCYVDRILLKLESSEIKYTTKCFELQEIFIYLYHKFTS